MYCVDVEIYAPVEPGNEIAFPPVSGRPDEPRVGDPLTCPVLALPDASLTVDDPTASYMGQYDVEENVFIALVYEDVEPTVTPVGALGMVGGPMTVLDAAEATEVPMALVAVTVKL